MDNQTEKKFFEVFAKDKSKFIENWLVTWEYQRKRDKRKQSYPDHIPSQFDKFNGRSDLIKWMNWVSDCKYPDFFNSSLVKTLIDSSYSKDIDILNKLELSYPSDSYHETIGRYNAQDYLLTHFYSVPSKYEIKTVLDFGAGYGRQANLFIQKTKDCVYTGMDAVPNSYCLQNLYYSNMGVPFNDYLDKPDSFKIDIEKPGIYHLPTWRYDLLPSAAYDLVICVQVLPELSTKLVKKITGIFHRILKPGGMLYIRDHEQKWKPAEKININNYLQNNGFSLEFRPHVINGVDLHGVPRIFRKVDMNVVKSQTMNFQSKIKQGIDDVDSFLGGLLGMIKKKIKK